MAFPTDTHDSSVEAAAATSHDIVLAASVANDLLIEIFCIAITGDTITWPSSGDDGPWTALGSITTNTNIAVEARYRTAVGAEGLGMIITSATARRSAHFSMVLGAGTYQGVPEIAFATGSDTAPNPPSLNPAAWDVEDTLWFAGQALAVDTTVTAYPTSYADNQLRINASGAGADITAARATRDLAAASDDPGTFTNGTTGAWVAWTIAVRPAGAAVVLPPKPTIGTVAVDQSYTY